MSWTNYFHTYHKSDPSVWFDSSVQVFVPPPLLLHDFNYNKSSINHLFTHRLTPQEEKKNVKNHTSLEKHKTDVYLAERNTWTDGRTL